MISASIRVDYGCKLLGLYFDVVEVDFSHIYRNKAMLLLLMSGIGSVLSCLTSYTILSGTRTYYYDPTSNELKQALVLPSSALYPTWPHDPEAVWVWWTRYPTTDTVKFKDTFTLAQWAVNKVNTAVLKIAADDYLTVTFNGEELLNTWLNGPYAAFAWLNLKDKLRGSSASEYNKLNILEMKVTSYGNFEGLVYRLDINFN